jgi:Na+-driven multidrug efflux pump
MGIAGIALSTVLITAGGALYISVRVRQTRLADGLSRRDFKPSWTAFREIIRQGLPASLNMMTVALGIFVITWFVSRYSAGGVAAYGIATRIEQIVLLPTIGLNIATLTLCGQNHGAGNLERVRQTWHTAVRYGLILMLLGGILLLAAGGPLMRAFTDEAAVIQAGRAYLHVAAWTLGSYVILYQTVFMLQGLKRPMFGLWVGLYRQALAPALVFPTLAFVMGLGLKGIWWGIALINWSAAIVAWFYGRAILQRLRKGRAPDPPQPIPSGEFHRDPFSRVSQASDPP